MTQCAHTARTTDSYPKYFHFQVITIVIVAWQGKIQSSMTKTTKYIVLTVVNGNVNANWCHAFPNNHIQCDDFCRRRTWKCFFKENRSCSNSKNQNRSFEKEIDTKDKQPFFHGFPVKMVETIETHAAFIEMSQISTIQNRKRERERDVCLSPKQNRKKN